ncbi:hypothetical protein O9993_17930 [Vibrio lentus]|nr:hypothetical protein [Vibrio lentus]
MQDSTLDIVEPTVVDCQGCDNTIDVCRIKVPMVRRFANNLPMMASFERLIQNATSSEQQFSFTEGELFITLQGEVRFEPNGPRPHAKRRHREINRGDIK